MADDRVTPGGVMVTVPADDLALPDGTYIVAPDAGATFVAAWAASANVVIQSGAGTA